MANGSRVGLGGPGEALSAAKIDLVELIRGGIPERDFVPGCGRWLIAGKRYMMPSPAGVGKSLAALIIALGVVEARGTVSILDVENGSDEYGRRLDDILAKRGGSSGDLANACGERLHYYEWPRLSARWAEKEWADAFRGVDLAVFDSSRLILSTAGLGEDSNDDYGTFVSSLLIPLSRAGVATLVLDNTGHADRIRARGASAKEDLNEVVYSLKVGERFDREHQGDLRLVLRRSRFSGLPAELRIPLGGGVYGPVVVSKDERCEPHPSALMQRLWDAIDATPGIPKKALREAVSGNNGAKDRALELLVAGRYVRVEPEGQTHRHFSCRSYPPTDAQGSTDD